MSIKEETITINKQKTKPWKARLHEIIFEADTPTGKLFDVILLWAIVISVIVVMLESVDSIQQEYSRLLWAVEWGFTILFSIEYILRVFSVGKPLKYMLSFFGIIDLLSILPTFIGIFVAGTHILLVIRTIRLLRVFRVLKLVRYLKEARYLSGALKASRPKIVVFLFVISSMVVILGTVMYLIEGSANGFTSIPRSIYWAIVTLTTVGYGDIAPQTVLGQLIASIVMILGYAVIAVPTGIVTAEMTAFRKEEKDFNTTRACAECSQEGHDTDAKHCKFCGEKF